MAQTSICPINVAVGDASSRLSRRSLLQGLGAAAGGLALSACSGGGTGSSGATISFLHNETDPPSVAFFKKAIAQYEADHPGAKVKMELVSTDGRLARLTSLQAARALPGIFKIVPEERYDFATRGLMEPLDDVLQDIGRGNFVPGAVVPIKNKVYDLPYTINQFGVYFFRKDLMRKAGVQAGTDWAGFRDVSKRLTESNASGGHTDVFGNVMPAGANRMTDIYFAELFWSAGGTFFDSNFSVSLDKGSAAGDALEMLRVLAKYSPEGIDAYSYSDMIDVYLARKTAQSIYAPRLVANMVSVRPDLLPLTGVARRPTGPSGAGVGYANPNSFAVSTKRYGNDNADACKEFLKYIVSGQRLSDFSLTSYPHMIAPQKSVQDELLQSPNVINQKYPELAKASYDLSNTMDFTTEAGASVEGGQLRLTGEFNPHSPFITSRNICTGMVQSVLIKGNPVAQAVKDAASKLRSAVAGD